MTACFKLMRTLQCPPLAPETPCATCVYFGKNLDATEYPVLLQQEVRCGLGYLPDDPGCAEMCTDNCSARKR